MNFDFGCIEGLVYSGVMYLKPTNDVDDVQLYPGIIPVRHHVDGWVHGLIYFEYLKRQLDLLKVWIEEKPERLEGYSLGAGWAKFLAIDIAVYANERPSVHLKGSPFLGTQGFADTYNRLAGDTIQEVYGRDIVTAMIPGAAKEKGVVYIGGKTEWWQAIKMFRDHGEY